MRPKIEFEQIRDLDEVVSDSIVFFKQNFKPLLKVYFSICGFFLFVSLVLGIINILEMRVRLEEGTSVFSVAYFLSTFFNFISVSMTVTTILSYLTLYRKNGNEAPTVQEVWAYVKSHIIKIFAANVVIAIIVAIAFVFCILPGLYFLPVLSLILPIMMMEEARFGYAFDRCFKLVKGHWWQVFGSLFLVTIVLSAFSLAFMVPAGLITEVYALITGGSFAKIYQIPVLISSICVQVLYALPIIALTLNYFSLIEQKEGSSLMRRIEMLGTTGKSNNDHLATEEY